MSEFGGLDGPHGIDPRRVRLTANHKLRLGYAVGVEDPTVPHDEVKHAWHGTHPSFYETPEIVEAKEKLEE